MMTLFTIAGREARIFTLPNRPDFMLAADLADIYGSSVKRLGEAVSRNPDRFPSDFMFALSEDETSALRSQFATANAVSPMARYAPNVFTHAGSLMLSAVLKSQIAAQVSVEIHRAFAAMEARALAEATYMLQRLQGQALGARSIKARVKMASEHGWSFAQLWRDCGQSRPKLVQAVRDCVALGLIPAPLAGTPATLAPLPGQRDLFSPDLTPIEAAQHEMARQFGG